MTELTMFSLTWMEKRHNNAHALLLPHTEKHRNMYLHFLTLLVIGLPFFITCPSCFTYTIKSVGFKVLQGLGFTFFFFFFFFFFFNFLL